MTRRRRCPPFTSRNTIARGATSIVAQADETDTAKRRRDVPLGFREGIDRLSQRLKERDELTGNFSDYRVIIPPNYKGDETEYEIGFLRPGVTFYVFRTIDGGQTWSPLPPTNPYLIKISNREVERARRTAGSGTPGARHPTRGIKVEPPRIPRNSGQLAVPEVTLPTDEEPHPGGPLSGTWQASTGARFRIEDDGKTITIDLVHSDSLRVLSGKLTRSEEEGNANSLTGTLIAAFTIAPKDYTIRVSATIEDDNHLHLRCENWPKFDRRTKKVPGKVVLNELWTRSNMAPMGHHRQ